MLADVFLHHALQILGVVEEAAQCLHLVFEGIEQFLALAAGLGLYTADAGSYAAFAHNLEETDTARAAGVDTAAELTGGTEAHHAHLVAVLLTEERHGAQLAGFLDGGVAVLVERHVLAYHAVHDALHLAQFLFGHFLVVAEVETQGVGAHKRTLLLHMVAQHLLQRIVQQVGGGVVGSAGVALVGVYTGHERCLRVFGQGFHDVDALVVLAFGVDYLHRLALAHQHALVAHLATHLTVEGGIVEHQLIEGVLLLRHLAVAQYLAFVFGEVVAHKLLLALAYHRPVAVLHSGGVAGAVFLLLHLLGKLLLVDGEAVLAANQLGQVEGESVGVEETEGLHTVEHGLAFCLHGFHGAVEQRDALVECAQERVFFFLYHTLYEGLLGGQLGVGSAHFPHQCGNQLEEEGFLPVEEGVGVAHGAAQDAAYHIAGLGIAGQLAVGDAERYGAQMVGHYAHGHVGLFFLAVFHA